MGKYTLEQLNLLKQEIEIEKDLLRNKLIIVHGKLSKIQELKDLITLPKDEDVLNKESELDTILNANL